MTDDQVRRRRPRTDKLRNHAQILDVAERFFAERGVSGSLEAIAKLAGVGTGTFYRHFPTREALLAALLQARYDDLVARRDTIRREEKDSSVALERWLDALDEWVTAFDGLPEPLRDALDQEASPLTMSCQWFVTTTDEFLALAQRDGTVEPWVRGRDLFLNALAAAWVRGAALADESSTRTLRRLMRSGFAARTPGRAPQGAHLTPFAEEHRS
ncbi:TetR family transcriptional regulator [Actinoplanes sp. OR16]|uniref:TetR/AcrR family transcriptional regulator n=1 Tax=Actinoplanes sp. OR16 TaxID=946334 RepID=UPI000F7010C4|nr:TetR/AcrR family transcriptional regulator [Actinoplanes sp. OR16]BBH69557.1 TetR family transcriptional regulator [Actinoplanes sp. OR16]